MPLRRNALRAAIGIAGLSCLLAIGFLISEIIREFRYLRSASSDNVQWVLSQAEVEFLEYQLAVRRAHQTPTPMAFNQVVIEFDVFYSRTTTLATGALYQPLAGIEGFARPLAEVRKRLDAMIPLIDGPREELHAGLDRMDAENAEIRLLLREMATSGLGYFTRLSDQSRETVTRTLMRLALVTLVLMAALVLVLVHTRRVSQQVERRNIELTDAYARQHTILETSLDAVTVTDIRGNVLNFNSAAERIFGYSVEEALGQNIADLFIPDHLREAHLDGIGKLLTGGEPRVVGKGRVRLEAKRRNGEIFPVELALAKAKTGDDMIIVGFMRDISHRVRAEKELIDARDRALAGEKAKSDFLAMMTHEIRTPLNGLLGNLSLLSAVNEDEDQARYLRNMKISGDVLMGHVDAVLDVARFEAGAAPPKVEALHPGRLLQDLVDGQAGAAALAGNQLDWSWIGPPAGWIRADGARLRQVLLNLLGNAIKFTAKGRIMIEAEQMEETPPMLEIRVIDTGIGISDEDQEKVFDDFETIANDPNAGFGGTGLGLGIARRFITAMGGEIGVESSPGEGSLFWIRIPLIAAEPPAEATAPAPEIPMRPCRVLLVEDAEINRELAREMLTRLGHQVVEVMNGAEAIDAAGSGPFDLILMDIRMPVLDGLAATRAIRAGKGPNAKTPVIALSANVLPEARDRFMQAGMSGFLAKPLVPDELKRVISGFCNGKLTAGKQEVTTPREKLEALRIRHINETKAFFDWLANSPDDRHAIADNAHRIAGTAAAFGQPALAKALIALEQAAGKDDADTVTSAIAIAETAWANAPDPGLA